MRLRNQRSEIRKGEGTSEMKHSLEEVAIGVTGKSFNHLHKDFPESLLHIR